MSKPCILIQTPTERHVEILARTMRRADRLEVTRAGFQQTPREALEFAIGKSEHSYVMIVDGQPLLMWGISKGNATTNEGYPWLLTAEGIERRKKLFVAASRVFLKELLTICPVLKVMIDAKHHRAIRWARWLGFEIGAPEPYGLYGQPFVEATYKE